MRITGPPASASLVNPEYWWYVARTQLLRTVFEEALPSGQRLLDVGSADGPSVAWTRGVVERTPIDLFPGGLPEGGVCGSILALPFRDQAFGAISAFDVIEHVDDDRKAVCELLRTLAPGGVLMVSVPAYQWAWSPFDVEAGHYRRYTRRRIVQLLRSEGAVVTRATYAFATTFPLFVLDRITARLGLREGEDPAASGLLSWVERVLLRLSALDQWILARRDMPFGSSVLVLARKRG